MIRTVGATRPRVERDRVLAGEVHEGRAIVGEHVGDLAAALADGGPGNPMWEVGGNLLHQVAAALYALGIDVQGEGPVADVRDHRRSHAVVMTGEVQLRQSHAGENDTVGVSDLDRAAAGADPLGHPGCAFSRTTSRG